MAKNQTEMTQQLWHTPKDLVSLDGLPGSVQGIIAKAKRELWQSRRRTGRGGGNEYHINSLPETTRLALAEQTMDLVAIDDQQTKQITIKPAVAVQPVATMKQWQQNTMDARLQIVRLVQGAEPKIGVTKAVKTIVEKANKIELPPHIQTLIPQANARSPKSGKNTLSVRTLMRWWSLYKNSGYDYRTLAPVAVEKTHIPVWLEDFLKLYRQPAKPSMRQAHKDLTKIMGPQHAPSYNAVARYIKNNYSNLDIHRGRKSGTELRAHQLYRTRDSSMFQPMDITQTDGHTFKATVAHPAHGRPFAPEICGVKCIVTKAIVGWSTGLAESAQTVADAFRHAVTVTDQKPMGGIMAISESDGGSGFIAHVNSNDVAGLLPRLGVTFKKGRAGNPQGRGSIERTNSSIWIPLAKTLPTYRGKDMDSGVGRKIYLATQKAVRDAKREDREINSPYLIKWDEFIQLIEDHVYEYNYKTPHSSLPKITDTTGRNRHMTPAENWEYHVQQGWQATTLPQEDLDALFRPHVTAKCTRGIITLNTNKYSHKDLEHYAGQELVIAYDIHDPSKIIVKDTHLRTICIAERDHHKSPHFAVAEVELAKERRYKNRMKVIDDRAEEIKLERNGVDNIFAQQEHDAVIETAERYLEQTEPITPAFRLPQNPSDRYDYWRELDVQIAQGQPLNEQQKTFYSAFKNSHDWQAFNDLTAAG